MRLMKIHDGHKRWEMIWMWLSAHHCFTVKWIPLEWSGFNCFILLFNFWWIHFLPWYSTFLSTCRDFGVVNLLKNIFELDSILAEPICWIVFFFRAKDEFGDHPPLYNCLHEEILLGTCMYHQQAYRCFKHLNDEYFGRWNHHISEVFFFFFNNNFFSGFSPIFHLLYCIYTDSIVQWPSCISLLFSLIFLTFLEDPAADRYRCTVQL